MLRQALGFWLVSLLMFVPVVHAQDYQFDEADASDAAEASDPAEPSEPTESSEPSDEEIVELAGVDSFVRESWYIQVAFAHATDQKFEKKLEQNVNRAVAPPPSLFLPDPNFVTPGAPYGAPGQLIAIGPVDVTDSNGADIRFGRRLNPNFAVEFQLEYQKFEATIEEWARIETKTLAFTVNFKIPILTGRIQPYGLLGGGFIYAHPSEVFPIEDILPSRQSSDVTKYNEIVDARDFGGLFRMGAGVDYYFTDHVYAMAEATWVVSQGKDVDDIRYISYAVGLGYRF